MNRNFVLSNPPADERREVDRLFAKFFGWHSFRYVETEGGKDIIAYPPFTPGIPLDRVSIPRYSISGGGYAL